MSDPVQQKLDALAAQVRSLRALMALASVLALAALVVAGFALSRPGATAPAAAAPAATASASPTPVVIGTPADAGAAIPGAIVLGPTGQGLPVVDVFEDYQCPACASVQTVLGPQVDALVQGGRTEVRFHLMSFLDQMLGNDSSVRAAAGAFCAHDQDRFLAWHNALWANHPAAEGDGWTDAQLEAIAGKAGLDAKAWGACVASGKSAGRVADANEGALAAGVNSTPTFRLNGTRLDLQSVVNAGGLETVVDSAR